MVGRLNSSLENIDELNMLHMMTSKAVWKSTERVALRLEKSDFNALKHWRALTTIPNSNFSSDVWDRFSLFLASCSDEVFKEFFGQTDSAKVNLGEFLEFLGENNSSGEEIFAFFYNISYALKGRPNKKVDFATNLIRQKLADDPNSNLIEMGRIYNIVQGNKGNNFLSFSKREKSFKKY